MKTTAMTAFVLGVTLSACAAAQNQQPQDAPCKAATSTRAKLKKGLGSILNGQSASSTDCGDPQQDADTSQQPGGSTGQINVSDDGSIVSNGIAVTWVKQSPNQEIPTFEIKGVRGSMVREGAIYMGRNKSNGRYYIQTDGTRGDPYVIEITGGLNPSLRKLAALPDGGRDEAYDDSWAGKAQGTIDRSHMAGTEGATDEPSGDPFNAVHGKSGTLTDSEGQSHQVVFVKTLPTGVRIYTEFAHDGKASHMFKVVNNLVETLEKSGDYFVDATGLKYTLDGTVIL